MIGNIYNAKSMNAFNDAYAKTVSEQFKDSAGSIIAENFRMLDPKILEQVYAEQTFFNTGVKISNFGGVATRITSMKVGGQGKMSVVGGATRGQASTISLETGLSEIVNSEYRAVIRWSRTDEERMALGGADLRAQQFKQVDRAYKDVIDNTFYVGNDNNSVGILNAFSATAYSAVTTGITAQELYNVIANIIHAQNVAIDLHPKFMANILEMPRELYSLLANTILNSNANSDTVLNVLKRNYPGVTFLSSWRMGTIGGNGKMVAYNNSEDNMIMRVPKALEISQIQEDGFDYKAESRAFVAGLDVLENDAGLIYTGL